MTARPRRSCCFSPAFGRTGGIRRNFVHRELERGRGDIARIEALLQAWSGAPTELGKHAWWDVRARSADVESVP